MSIIDTKFIDNLESQAASLRDLSAAITQIVRDRSGEHSPQDLCDRAAAIGELVEVKAEALRYALEKHSLSEFAKGLADA